MNRSLLLNYVYVIQISTELVSNKLNYRQHWTWHELNTFCFCFLNTSHNYKKIDLELQNIPPPIDIASLPDLPGTSLTTSPSIVSFVVPEFDLRLSFNSFTSVSGMLEDDFGSMLTAAVLRVLLLRRKFRTPPIKFSALQRVRIVTFKLKQMLAIG